LFPKKLPVREHESKGISMLALDIEIPTGKTTRRQFPVNILKKRKRISTSYSQKINIMRKKGTSLDRVRL
jgi:hypothetical protein